MTVEFLVWVWLEEFDNDNGNDLFVNTESSLEDFVKLSEILNFK